MLQLAAAMSHSVLILMGSDSDLEVMSAAAKHLDKFGISYQITIASAHRAPERVQRLCSEAYDQGVRVIIAAAGSAAHLAGVCAATSGLPVIGVPIGSGALRGMDALYSTVQMPSGIPVATVAIDGAANAAILAAQILATSDVQLYQKILKHKEELKNTVELKASKLEELGYQAYLKGVASV